MQYRRARAPGGTFFFTVVAWRRHPVFMDRRFRELIGQGMRWVRRSHPFSVDAIVLLPDHLHCIWSLPAQDVDYSVRWRLIKRHVSLQSGGARIWQPRFWEHMIRDDADFRHHVDYVHYNPVRHGYATAPADWPWSSFARHVQRGIYPRDWGSTLPRLPEAVGRE